MNGLHFSNFLPNIWVGYVIKNKPATNCEITLKKFCKIHSIKKVIRLDSEVDYWLKSRSYASNIKQQVMQNEIAKLTKYYKNKNRLLYDNYFDSIGTLIISNHNLEITTGLLINFLIHYSGQEKQKAYVSLQSIPSSCTPIFRR